MNHNMMATLLGLLSMILFAVLCYVIWLIVEHNR